MDIHRDWKPTVLVLSSGGVKGINLIGGLYYFYRRGHLDKVETFIGSSVGAIILTLYICGWTPLQIMEEALEMTLFDNYADIKWTQIANEFGIIPNSSFDDAMARKLTKMITSRLGRMPTLGDLYEITGKHMIFTVVSLREEKEYYFDHTNRPHMDLLTVMRMTSNSPGVFGKLKHQEDFWVDGAVLIPFPIAHVDDGHTQILAIGLSDKNKFDMNMNALTYFNRMISMILTRLTTYAVANASDAVFSIVIPVTDELSMLDPGNTADTRMKMFIESYRFVESYVARHQPKRLVPNTKTTPLTADLLRSCLDTYSAKILLRAMSEQPQLLDKCLTEKGITLQTTPASPTQPETAPTAVQTQALYIPELDDDEVIEIPRSVIPTDTDMNDAFRAMFQDQGFAIPRNMPPIPTHMQMTLSLNIDPQQLEALFMTGLDMLERFGPRIKSMLEVITGGDLTRLVGQSGSLRKL